MPWIETDARPLPGQMMERELAGHALLIYNLDGHFRATSAICPHHAAWLSDGQISGGSIDCPRHMGRFHIATGRQLRGPHCADLRVYPVRQEGGRILIEIG